MHKTILITGSTDGIGRATAKRLLALGHRVLLHGRSLEKLERVRGELAEAPSSESVSGFAADLSTMAGAEALAREVSDAHPQLDVLINNAGVFAVPDTRSSDGLDLRFAVNTLAPYLLTRRLLPLLGESGRVINLSSAAQAPVDLRALAGELTLPDSAAYAQSKLALTMWSFGMARQGQGPMIVAVNPGSMLGTKMVQDAYGVAGADISIGAEILERAALSEEFAAASGQYFNNDAGRFAPPHRDALDDAKVDALMVALDSVLRDLGVEG